MPPAPTFLAVAGGPAAIIQLSIDAGLHTRLLHIQDARADVSTLFSQLIANDVGAVPGVGQQQPPVDGGQVAELLVALNAHRTAEDVAQAVQPHVPQVRHLEDDQGVAEEEVGAADDGEVGEEIPQALQPVDAEKEQVLRDHKQAREAEPPKVLGARGEHQQDLQVAFDDGAVFQLPELGHVIADVHAAADWGGERGTPWAAGTGQLPPTPTQRSPR